MTSRNIPEHLSLSGMFRDGGVCVRPHPFRLIFTHIFCNKYPS